MGDDELPSADELDRLLVGLPPSPWVSIETEVDDDECEMEGAEHGDIRSPGFELPIAFVGGEEMTEEQARTVRRFICEARRLWPLMVNAISNPEK